jgi:hypothetical protein
MLGRGVPAIGTSINLKSPIPGCAKTTRLRRLDDTERRSGLTVECDLDEFDVAYCDLLWTVRTERAIIIGKGRA